MVKSIITIQAAIRCAEIATNTQLGIGLEEDQEVKTIPLITGSMAEFYIEPMLQHVGDIDIMCHVNYQLAIPRGHPPPIHLPAEFHDAVNLFEITDSHLSGYVYLHLRCLLTKHVRHERYQATQYWDHEYYQSLDWASTDLERHGPARMLSSENADILSLDEVRCVRCLLWPTQATDWPTRPRNNGWPDSATVDGVVSNGCDVVQVPHRLCKEHEWMSTHQWRLSFSRAEIVLLNSWMPVQQIIYHVLRVFLKAEQLLENSNNSREGMLSNYHIKTLMLWKCEQKPKCWWNDDLNLVRMCIELLHNLADWLTEAQCPHYFINCNLVDKSFSLETITSCLRSIDRDQISSWYVNCYIRQSVEICPESVSWLFDDVSTTKKLENAVSAAVDWRLNTTSVDTWRALCEAEHQIACICPNSRWFNVMMTELSKVSTHLCVYFTGIAFLYHAYEVTKPLSMDRLFEVTKLATEQLDLLSNYYSERTFIWQNKTLILVTNDCSSLVQLLLQTAVELLTTSRELAMRDFGSVVTIVTTDFEALYAYSCCVYQRCLQLSIQNVCRTLNAEHMSDIAVLPEFIQLLDDDIVSLTALTLIVNPKCRLWSLNGSIMQLTLSLYLITQCQLKLRYSLKSLAHTLIYVKAAERRYNVHLTLDRLTLKLIKRKLMLRLEPVIPAGTLLYL